MKEKQPNHFLLLAVCMLFAVTGCSATPAQSPEKQTLEVALSFQAKWWSEDQMEGLDLDNPPAKRALIELQRWEASDPVSTPHPSSFDVVATVEMPAHVENPSLRVMHRWGIGRLSDGKPTDWTPWQAIEPRVMFDTSGKQSQTTTLTSIDLDREQKQLYQKGQWPWIYDVRVEVTAQDAGSILRTQTSKQLSILAGD